MCSARIYALYKLSYKQQQWELTAINLGEFHLSAIIDSCLIDGDGRWSLIGDVHYDTPSSIPAPEVEIWKADPVGEGVLEPTSLLGTTDEKGRFRIQAINLKYMMVMEDSATAIIYELQR